MAGGLSPARLPVRWATFISAPGTYPLPGRLSIRGRGPTEAAGPAMQGRTRAGIFISAAPAPGAKPLSGVLPLPRGISYSGWVPWPGLGLFPGKWRPTWVRARTLGSYLAKKKLKFSSRKVLAFASEREREPLCGAPPPLIPSAPAHSRPEALPVKLGATPLGEGNPTNLAKLDRLTLSSS